MPCCVHTHQLMLLPLKAAPAGKNTQIQHVHAGQLGSHNCNADATAELLHSATAVWSRIACRLAQQHSFAVRLSVTASGFILQHLTNNMSGRIKQAA